VLTIAAILTTPLISCTAFASDEDEVVGEKRKLRDSTENQDVRAYVLPFEPTPRRRKSRRPKKTVDRYNLPSPPTFIKRRKLGSSKSRCEAHNAAPKLARNQKADREWATSVVAMRTSQDVLRNAYQNSDLSLICKGAEDLSQKQGLRVMKKALCFWKIYEMRLLQDRFQGGSAG
jgi:hypothetical protein